jgi:Fic family protein
MEYMSVKQGAARWGISERRIRVLCAEGKISGAFQAGRGWNIPTNAEKPKDGRLKTQADIFLRIEEKKRLLDEKRPLTEGEVERLTEEFAVEYTYHSNAIEGNTLTLRETDMVLRGMTIDKKPLKDHLEAIGHKEAFDYISDMVKERQALTESMIKQIHALVLMDRKEDRGVYRRVPVRILGALHTPPEPYLVAMQMERLLDGYRENDENVIKSIALFHLKFEGIHPFIDGNGRTGRLIANLELMKSGYPPISIKYEDRARYYKAFDEYYGAGNLGAMSDLFAEYVEMRLDGYLRITE